MTRRASAAVNFNTTIAGVEEADAILLVGTNLRWEAPLVNTRIRKAVKKGAKVFAIGPETDLTYKVEWLGDDLSLLGKLPEAAAEAFDEARKRPMVIVGGGGAARAAHGAALALAESLEAGRGTGWNGFNVLHIAAARMGGLMLGYRAEGRHRRYRRRQARSWCSSSAPTRSISPQFAGSFKVYIGHHGDKGAHAADVILPGASYAEKPGTYVNLEGRVQRGERAVFPPGDAREDWTILRALSDDAGPHAAVRQLRASCARRWRRTCRRSGRRGWSTLRLEPAQARRQGASGTVSLSDPGLLPDQRDLPRQPDDAALLGRTGPRRRIRGGGGMMAHRSFPCGMGRELEGIACDRSGARALAALP